MPRRHYGTPKRKDRALPARDAHTMVRRSRKVQTLVSLPANLFAGILSVLIVGSRDNKLTEELLKDVKPYITDDVREIMKETRKMMDKLAG